MANGFLDFPIQTEIDRVTITSDYDKRDLSILNVASAFQIHVYQKALAFSFEFDQSRL